MYAFQVGWAVSLVVTVLALPVGLVRLIAFAAGVEQTLTLRVAAMFAVTVGAAGLLGLIGFTLAIALQ
ncbi:MAG TPA: hypothetical protein VFJ19_19690 [Nocardioidaceae bacterium]|nr:hypothetical protein [Nocardioidaceae bacterium]